jgi:hypothetical protein
MCKMKYDKASKKTQTAQCNQVKKEGYLDQSRLE